MKPTDYIPTPCPEDVNCMPGNDQQSFCTKCNKHILNLTNHTDEQIRSLDKKYKGNLCGYFRLAVGTTAVSLAACTTPITKNETTPFNTTPNSESHRNVMIAGGICPPEPSGKKQ